MNEAPIVQTYEELVHYTPNEKQREFHGSRATFRLAWGG
jgi:hypothetical protein